jgi:hypothetical protein
MKATKGSLSGFSFGNLNGSSAGAAAGGLGFRTPGRQAAAAASFQGGCIHHRCSSWGVGRSLGDGGGIVGGSGDGLMGDDVASDVDTGDSGSSTTCCGRGGGGGGGGGSSSYEIWHEELSSRVRNAIRKLEQPAMML